MSLIVIIFVICKFSEQLPCIYGNSDYNGGSSTHNEDVPGEPLSPLDFKNAEKLSSFSATQPSSDMPYTEDPTEKGGYYDGDIVVDAEERSSTKNSIRDTNKKWGNGTVPYLISSKFGERERSVIARAVLEYKRQTCITFTPRSTEPDYIMITTGEGCSSPVGRRGGYQYVTLGEGCIYSGIVMHELMHTIGFWHEQSRWDRDDYVTVHSENIQSGMEDNFRKVSWKDTQHFNASYDTSSIMHYGPYAFSKNRQKYKTITPKVSNDKMGQRQNFSEIDVFKINKLYNCSKQLDGNESDTGGAANSDDNNSGTPAPNNGNASGDNSQKCIDNHHNCQKWASNGECQKNPNWMLVNCKLSCNQCRSSCTNSNKNCDAWAASGECSKNPGYMNAHCAKACKKC